MINNIELKNFRNHINRSFDFKKETIIVGDNGKGKTNLIEAIGLLTTGRSFRTRSIDRLLNKENQDNFFRVGGDFLIESKKRSVSFFYDPEQNSLLLEGKKIKKTRLISLIPTIFFSPELFGIIVGGPSIRRRYFDILFSTFDSNYALVLIEYLKTILQRNRTLSMLRDGITKDDHLSVWTQRLLSIGSELIDLRKEYSTLLDFYLPHHFSNLSGTNDHMGLQYNPHMIMGSWADALENQKELEIKKGFTLSGPHRDDYIFTFNENKASHIASRGQIRLMVLALKAAEIDALKTAPLLLLDDPFSELDDKRKNLVTALFSKAKQVIVTSTKEAIPSKIINNFSVVEI